MLNKWKISIYIISIYKNVTANFYINSMSCPNVHQLQHVQDLGLAAKVNETLIFVGPSVS